MTRGSTRETDHRSGLPDVGSVSIGPHDLNRLTSGQAALHKTNTLRRGDKANRGPVPRHNAMSPNGGVAAFGTRKPSTVDPNAASGGRRNYK